MSTVQYMRRAGLALGAASSVRHAVFARAGAGGAAGEGFLATPLIITRGQPSSGFPRPRPREGDIIRGVVFGNNE